jgi:hypothetical protein
MRSESRISRRKLLAMGASGVLSSAWHERARAVTTPANEPAVVVLDDADPDYKGPGPHRDGVTVLGIDGTELWSRIGLNNCETSGAHHGVAVDRRRERIYVREIVGDRVTAYDFAGNVVYRVDETADYALAVDPVTGNLWCTGSGDRTIVLDSAGKLLARHSISGFDLAYDQPGDTFWIVGPTSLKRLDRSGKPLVREFPDPVHGYFSVACAPFAEGAWLVERSHPQVAGSIDQVLFVSNEGKRLKQVHRPGWHPFGVACDARSSAAWVVDLRNALLRIPLEGDDIIEQPIPAVAVAVASSTGHVWAATADHLLRLDDRGRVELKLARRAPSQQCWLAAV